MGGSGADYAVGLAVDSQGQVYLAGNTSSTDFPITSPPLQGTPYGSDSGFIVCLNGSGSAVVYTTSIGPSTIYAMALSSGGNLYLTGLAGSTFPTTLGAYSRTIPASTAAVFAAKLNSNGTNFAFSTFVGPGFPSKISVDSAGSAIIAGYGYQGYPLSPGSFPFGGPSSVVTKLSPDGSQLSYSTTFHLSSFGGSITGLVIDSLGNPLISEQTTSVSQPTTPGAFQATNHVLNTSNPTGFLQKIDLTSPTFCTLSVATTSITVPPGGGSGSIGVTAPIGCPWQALSLSTDLVLNKASGVGSGALTYTIPPNNYLSPYSAGRSMLLQIAQFTVTLVQDVCTYSVSPTSVQIPLTSGTFTLSEVTNPGCMWNVLSGASWLTPPYTGAVTGTGTISISYSANGGASRTGVLYLPTQTVAVMQPSAGSMFELAHSRSA